MIREIVASWLWVKTQAVPPVVFFVETGSRERASMPASAYFSG